MTEQAEHPEPSDRGALMPPRSSPWTPGWLAIGAVALALVAGLVGGVIGAFIRSDNDPTSTTGVAAAVGEGCNVAAVAQQVIRLGGHNHRHRA